MKTPKLKTQPPAEILNLSSETQCNFGKAVFSVRKREKMMKTICCQSLDLHTNLECSCILSLTVTTSVPYSISPNFQVYTLYIFSVTQNYWLDHLYFRSCLGRILCDTLNIFYITTPKYNSESAEKQTKKRPTASTCLFTFAVILLAETEKKQKLSDITGKNITIIYLLPPPRLTIFDEQRQNET